MKKSYILALSFLFLLPIGLCAEPRVLLLDLGGLFYKFSAFSYTQELGLGNIISYAIRDFKNPKGLEKIIFGMLQAIPEDEIRQHSDDFDQTVWYKKLRAQQSAEKIEAPHITPTRTTSGKELPYLISAYQAGHISDKAAMALAYKKLEEFKAQGYGQGHFLASDREAYLVAEAIRLIFTPEVNAAMNSELRDGVKLLQELASQNHEDGTKKFVLAALSNADKRAAHVLEVRFKKSIFSKFQHLFYSGDLGTIKPNDEAYTLVFEALNELPEFREQPLTLDDIVFMDDQPENVLAAKRVGIQNAILYKNAEQAREELVKLGVLAPKVETPSSITLTNSLVAGGVVLSGAYFAYQYCN